MGACRLLPLVRKGIAFRDLRVMSSLQLSAFQRPSDLVGAEDDSGWQATIICGMLDHAVQSNFGFGAGLGGRIVHIVACLSRAHDSVIVSPCLGSGLLSFPLYARHFSRLAAVLRRLLLWLRPTVPSWCCVGSVPRAVAASGVVSQVNPEAASVCRWMPVRAGRRRVACRRRISVRRLR